MVHARIGAFEQGRNDVEESKGSVINDFEVGGVGILRQDIVACARLHEVDVAQGVALIEDVFIWGGHTSLKDRADPRDELDFLVLQEVNLGVDLLVDVDRKRRLQVDR